MEVTPQTLIDLNIQFRFLFDSAFARQTPIWDKKAFKQPAMAFEGAYGFRGQLPDMREWIGDRIVRGLASYVYKLANKPYELTIGVDRRSIEFDQIGQYAPEFRDLGTAAARWPDRLITDAQVNNGLAFDGQSFYDTDHPVSLSDTALGTYANDFTNRPLNADNLWFLIQTMMAYNDDGGRNLGLLPTILEVPGNLARDAVDAIKQLAYVQRVKDVAGAENVAAVVIAPNQGPALPFPDITPVVNPLLTATDRYYLHSTNRMMPFILQVAKDPTQSIAFTNPNDPSVFWQRKYVWGIDADGAGGYTMPFLSIRAKTTA
jgi:phage major head subunit gpT-like protein